MEAFDINDCANDVYEHNFGHRPLQASSIISSSFSSPTCPNDSCLDSCRVTFRVSRPRSSTNMERTPGLCPHLASLTLAKVLCVCVCWEGKGDM